MLISPEERARVKWLTPHPLRKLAVLGAGGNIGSHFTPHAARMPWESVLLLDQDDYESKNLTSQAIVPSEVGKAKASVQKRRMRRIKPELQVDSITARIEDTPIGQLRADLYVCCFDSRAARLVANQRAWRLGIPWIDVAVHAMDLMARVNVYVPSDADAACLTCSWDASDYDAVEQEYPCLAGRRAAVSTNAPACLGAIAAGLAAAECEKMLAGEWSNVLWGKQHLLDLRHHTHTTTTYRRNPNCRFDHGVWEIEPVAQRPGKLTLAAFLKIVGVKTGCSDTTLRLEGFQLARRLYCVVCNAVGPETLCVASRLGRRHCCPSCGSMMAARGFELEDRLRVHKIGRRQLQRSLSSLGLRAGDVVSVGDEQGERHFELGCGVAACPDRVYQ